MNDIYLKDVYENIFGVKGEKTIPLDYPELRKKMDIEILVTFKKGYFNVYFIDPIFKIEPLNNLNEQIPLENEPKNWIEYLRLRYIEYKAWRDFNYEGSFIKEN